MISLVLFFRKPGVTTKKWKMTAPNFRSSSILVPNSETRMDVLQHRSLFLEVAYGKKKS
jgi:hypothetical protein